MEHLRGIYENLLSSCSKSFDELIAKLPSDGLYQFFKGEDKMELDDAITNGDLPLIGFTVESSGEQVFEYVLEVNAGGFIKTVQYEDLEYKERKFRDVNDVYYMISLIEELDTIDN